MVGVQDETSASQVVSEMLNSPDVCLILPFEFTKRFHGGLELRNEYLIYSNKAKERFDGCIQVSVREQIHEKRQFFQSLRPEASPCTVLSLVTSVRMGIRG
jgi:hypothetical protein